MTIRKEFVLRKCPTQDCGYDFLGETAASLMWTPGELRNPKSLRSSLTCRWWGNRPTRTQRPAMPSSRHIKATGPTEQVSPLLGTAREQEQKLRARPQQPGPRRRYADPAGRRGAVDGDDWTPHVSDHASLTTTCEFEYGWVGATPHRHQEQEPENAESIHIPDHADLEAEAGLPSPHLGALPHLVGEVHGYATDEHDIRNEMIERGQRTRPRHLLLVGLLVRRLLRWRRLVRLLVGRLLRRRLLIGLLLLLRRRCLVGLLLRRRRLVGRLLRRRCLVGLLLLRRRCLVGLLLLRRRRLVGGLRGGGCAGGAGGGEVGGGTLGGGYLGPGASWDSPGPCSSSAIVHPSESLARLTELLGGRGSRIQT